MSAALKPQRLSTSMVLAPNENKEWTERTTKQDMEKAINEHHFRKYSLTHTTPPMRMPIQRELRFDSLTPARKRILDGTHTSAPGTDRYSRLLQKQLRRISIKEIPTGMSTKSYIEGWKKAKKQTLSLMSIAMKSGISFETLKRGLNAVIPKKTSSPRVDKLRTIVLHAADTNFCYKHIAKKIVDVAEKIPGALALEQYARKGRRCGSQVLNKRITFDIWRPKRTPGIITPKHLHSNYDRICHSIAALTAQRLGIQESEVKFMTSTLQDMKHTIHTAFGDSTDSYGGAAWTRQLPPQGIDQGNGIGPTVWLIISSILLDIMRQLGYGAFYKAALSGDTLEIAGFSYVDDTDLTQSQTPTVTTAEEVLETIQEGLDTWEGLVKASGGALSNEKSCWWEMNSENSTNAGCTFNAQTSRISPTVKATKSSQQQSSATDQH
jgi:hypothetical protein